MMVVTWTPSEAPIGDTVVNDQTLAKIDRARLLLQEARDAKDAKRIVDMAHAAEVYAKRQKLSEEIVKHANAIKIDAITRMGEFLKTTEKNVGAKGNPGGRGAKIVRSPNGTAQPPTIASAGISKRQSSEAQAMATMKQAHPELHEKVKSGKVTVKAAVNALRRDAAQKERQKVADRLSAEAKTDAVVSRVDQGDCLKWLAAQALDSINLIISSPPYAQARLYLENGADLGIARTLDEWVEWMVSVYKAALRCCTGLVAFVVDGQTKDYRWSAAPELLVAALIREGITLRKSPIYYRKSISGSGGPDWLRNDYETVVCATRGGRLPWSDNKAMGHAPVYEPGGDPSHRLRDGRRANEANGAGYEPPVLANPGNVIHCKVGGGHMGSPLAHENEAPFPESLAEFFIRSFCPPGGVVGDPFYGSGTTGAVAVRLGRRFVGCDIRNSQVEVALVRISEVQPLAGVVPRTAHEPA
jgi:hypothetical protein